MAKQPPLPELAQQYMRMGMLEAAVELLEKACRRNPRDSDMAHLYALALAQTGRTEDAAVQMRAALRLRPRFSGFHGLLGNFLMMSGQAEAAVDAYREALKLDPSHGPALTGLSLAYSHLNQWKQAIETGRRAVAVTPEDFRSHLNLANALRGAGLMTEATQLLVSAVERFPETPEVLDRLLPLINYTDLVSPERAVSFARRYGQSLKGLTITTWPSSRDATRRLRVGFISPDMRTHSVAFFLEPILEHLNRDEFEVFAFCDTPRRDDTTKRLQTLCDHWRTTDSQSTGQVVEQIRDDAIDVLVELAGHTGGHRLAALAQGCAPVQITYLGYPGTTGVSAINFRIVDAWTDPPGFEQFVTEKLLRIEGCFLCYKPPPDAPAVAEKPPLLQNGVVTFGSFNSLPKYSDSVIEAWSRVLTAIPGSRLLLKNQSLVDEWVRGQLLDRLVAHAIDASRLNLRGRTASPAEHLAMYAEIDIALDTFPYNGTTTTCESLWMGVPTVCLTGTTHSGRVGLSLLTSVGVPTLVADDVEGYVRTAVELAADSKRLVEMRRTLRDRLASSMLCDAPAFARRFGEALRSAWLSYCRTDAG